MLFPTTEATECFNPNFGENWTPQAEKEAEKELYEGRWTYRLFPKRKPASLNSIIDSPCLMCPNDARCGAWSPISPNECPRLTMWILGLDQTETESPGES
jgi:hypothetical protein